jgi:hypothetical protein
MYRLTYGPYDASDDYRMYVKRAALEAGLQPVIWKVLYEFDKELPGLRWRFATAYSVVHAWDLKAWRARLCDDSEWELWCAAFDRVADRLVGTWARWSCPWWKVELFARLELRGEQQKKQNKKVATRSIR